MLNFWQSGETSLRKVPIDHQTSQQCNKLTLHFPCPAHQPVLVTAQQSKFDMMKIMWETETEQKDDWCVSFLLICGFRHLPTSPVPTQKRIKQKNGDQRNMLFIRWEEKKKKAHWLAVASQWQNSSFFFFTWATASLCSCSLIPIHLLFIPSHCFLFCLA